MTRTLLLGFALLGSAAFAAGAACNANVKEGCANGVCDFTTGSGGSTSSGVDGGGTGGGMGGAGLAMCSPPPPDTGEIPCDVFDVIHRRCNICHQGPPTAGGAPFPLLKLADTRMTYASPPYDIVWRDMARVIQPGAIPHMPFGSAPQLTVEEKKTLDDWFGKCAPGVPAGTGCFCPDLWPAMAGDPKKGCN